MRERSHRTEPPTETVPADNTDTTAGGGGTTIPGDTTWKDTIRINWDSLGTDTTKNDTMEFEGNSETTESDADGAAARLKRMRSK